MFRVVVLFIAISTLLGCSGRANLPKLKSLETLKHDQGYLIGTLSRDTSKPAPHAYSIYFRSRTTQAIYSVNAGRVSGSVPFLSSFSDDFSRKKEAGQVFAFLLPEGEYEFFDYHIYYSHQGVENSWRPENEFALPVKVEAGKINYFGQIKLIPKRAKFTLNIEAVDGGEWSVNGEKEKDIKIFRKLYPKLDWSQLVDRSTGEIIVR